MEATRTLINDDLARLRKKLNDEVEGGKSLDQMIDTVDAITELELLSTAMAGVKVTPE